MKKLSRDIRMVALVVLLVGAATGAGAVSSHSAAAATTTRQRVTMYAVATQVQYVNMADKITPARDHNPFNTDAKNPVAKKGKGGIPGNSVFFSFKLYANADLKQPIGSALYTCTFAFNQRASCDASYDLKGGTMFASGSVDFTGTSSALAVSGGTSKYIGANGEVLTTGPGPGAAAKNETRLDFILVS